MAKANQLSALLVPETKCESLETSEQRDGLYALKKRIGFVAALQIVVGNARTQMVDVVKANVAREPLENFRQLVERTAFECRSCVVPILPAFPIDVLELMLHVEQPHSRRASHHEDDQLD